MSTPLFVHLRAADTSVVFSFDIFGLPEVSHWGTALASSDIPGLLASSTPAAMNSSIDIPRSFSVAATRAQGWSGTPTFEITRQENVLENLTLVQTQHSDTRATFTLKEPTESVQATLSYQLDPAGVLHAHVEIENIASEDSLDISAVRSLMPLPARATEIMDFTGRWTHEHHPQRGNVLDGTWTRTSRRGRPGHDSSYLTMVGTEGFRFRQGEIWAAHTAWSGNQQMIVERLPEGAGVHTTVLGGGELIDSGELTLRPGETYRTPTVMFCWTDGGIDGITNRFHRSVRLRPNHPKTPRPLLLNTWEAVYFDHDYKKLTELADLAATVGVERLVLDDGWFQGRRNDQAGLGDWYVDKDVWPSGLRPLADHVHSLGMEFGLWFEPEMINPASSLATTHPEWVLQESPLLTARHQFVLDFSQVDLQNYIIERMDDVISNADVDFVKWDHNRDLHASLDLAGRRRTHQHTLGVYRVLREIRAKHPHLEIESCASGGAREDLGILELTDRVWASDCNDPVERQQIQRWTQALLPPELIGAHVGPAEAHTTHRQTDFSFRSVTALFGHAGIEWDLRTASREDIDKITAWTALYRELRGLLHTGVTVRGDKTDRGALLHGIVSEDRADAVFAWVRTETSARASTPRIPIPGLDPKKIYRVRIRDEAGAASRHQVRDPEWILNTDSTTFTGKVLGQGLPLPVLNPGQAMLLQFTEVQSPSED